MNESPVRLIGVTRRFGDTVALERVSLDIRAGSSVALVGPNGSGKSTLLGLLAGLATPDGGAIELGTAAGRAARVGVVHQRSALDPILTVRENLALHAGLCGLKRSASRERIRALAQRVGLTDRLHDRVSTLSGGLARRCDLARALLHEPGVLLLDEPTAGLDAASRRAFVELLDAERRERSMTVIHATHHADEAEWADRVVMLDRGRISADAPPAEMLAPLGERVVEAPGEPGASVGLLERMGLEPFATAHGAIARVTPGVDLAALLESGHEIRVRRPTLDDVQAVRLASDAERVS